MEKFEIGSANEAKSKSHIRTAALRHKRPIRDGRLGEIKGRRF
jgi:hypothetical protein